MTHIEVSHLARARLPRMAKLLRDDAANPTGIKFDLSTWAEPVAGMHHDHGINVWPIGASHSETIPVDCGTKGCAFGLAAISGEFAAEGLGYQLDPTYIGSGFGVLNPVLDIGLGFDNPTHFNAAKALFGISIEDARYFFDPDCYSTIPREAKGEIEVAERIERFLAGDVDEDYHPDYRDESGDEDDED